MHANTAVGCGVDNTMGAYVGTTAFEGSRVGAVAVDGASVGDDAAVGARTSKHFPRPREYCHSGSHEPVSSIG